jgi:hypothetical protein
MNVERGVAYYGCTRGERVKEELAEMKRGGLNALLIAISEFDLDFYHEGLKEVVKVAKDLGFWVDVDLWGWGKVFGGEPPSLFLQNHPDCHQIALGVKGSVPLPAACIQSDFRSYFLDGLDKILDTMEIDGIFLDEPHYSVVQSSEFGFKNLPISAQNSEFAFGCYCDRCRSLYRDKTGHEMSQEEYMSLEMLQFREEELLLFLKEACEKVKEKRKRVTVCLVPADEVKEKALGIHHWDKVASLPIDMLSTDPYWIHFTEERNGFVTQWTQKILNLAAQFQKRAQIWVQLFRIPGGREEEIAKGIELISSLEVEGKKVDSIFGWPYRAGKGTSLSSDNPEKVWKIFINALGTVLDI